MSGLLLAKSGKIVTIAGKVALESCAGRCCDTQLPPPPPPPPIGGGWVRMSPCGPNRNACGAGGMYVYIPNLQQFLDAHPVNRVFAATCDPLNPSAERLCVCIANDIPVATLPAGAAAGQLSDDYRDCCACVSNSNSELYRRGGVGVCKSVDVVDYTGTTNRCCCGLPTGVILSGTYTQIVTGVSGTTRISWSIVNVRDVQILTGGACVVFDIEGSVDGPDGSYPFADRGLSICMNCGDGVFVQPPTHPDPIGRLVYQYAARLSCRVPITPLLGQNFTSWPLPTIPFVEISDVGGTAFDGFLYSGRMNQSGACLSYSVDQNGYRPGYVAPNSDVFSGSFQMVVTTDASGECYGCSGSGGSGCAGCGQGLQGAREFTG